MHPACLRRRWRKRIRQAPAVFVGEVTAATGDGRVASVEVAEVWAGEVEAQVEVRGGSGDAGAISSVDRSYERNEIYLFVPYKGSGSVFHDNSCTATTVFNSRLERFRPDDASVTLPTPSATENHGGVAESGDARGIEFPWAPTAAAVLVLAGFVLLAMRRRSVSTK